MECSFLERASKFDILHPDRCGGFSFLEDARLYFNIIISFLYLITTMHVGVFKLNDMHVISYSVLTMFLIFGNYIFMGEVFSNVKNLKMRAVNIYKEGVYNNNALSFEVYKYFFLYMKKSTLLQMH